MVRISVQQELLNDCHPGVVECRRAEILQGVSQDDAVAGGIADGNIIGAPTDGELMVVLDVSVREEDLGTLPVETLRRVGHDRRRVGRRIEDHLSDHAPSRGRPVLRARGYRRGQLRRHGGNDYYEDA